MTLESMKDFIKRHPWKTAKNGSHAYVRIYDVDFRQDFLEFVIEIRETGYVSGFFGREYTYLDIDGYQYWTMGSPIEETIILNRAILKSDKETP